MKPDGTAKAGTFDALITLLATWGFVLSNLFSLDISFLTLVGQYMTPSACGRRSSLFP